MPQMEFGGGRKRRRGERAYKFKLFGEKGYPVDFCGSFHENLRALLEFGRENRSGEMPIWSFNLEVNRQPLLHLVLFVVEEQVEEFSVQLRCKHCEHIGWGNHLICNKRYHFMLPSKSDSDKFCALFEMQRERQSLHGVFHSNGFGHLLYIGGLETGSLLAGYEIMEFWDRLCVGLGARKVSLKDTSRKKGMDLRLLHSVAYGKPWFSQWNYTFGRGSYGVEEESYTNAVKSIQSIPLNFIGSTSNQSEMIKVILHKLQLLSGYSLTTIGQLFGFMLELKSRIPKESKLTSPYPAIMSDASCRWSSKRVEMAIHVIVETLKSAESGWISRQHIRDQARAYIGDTGLLDFVLKSLGNHLVGKYFIRRCLNPVTKVLEYCVEDISQTLSLQESYLHFEPALRPHQLKVSWTQLMKDIHHVYTHIFETGVLANLSLASRTILDSKHLVKDYGGGVSRNKFDKWKIHCSVMLINDDELEVATPYHCLVLRNYSVFDELKTEAERVFRETYMGLRDFTADTMRNISSKGSDLVFKTLKPGSRVVFEVKTRELMCEGEVLMAVDCVCGTKDDDGERMVTCDICQVQQHTRCVNIAESEEIPNIFLCSGCENNILSYPLP